MIKNGLYLSSLEKGSGTISVSLGLMQMLKAKYRKVAFFKPIVKYKDDIDTNLMIGQFSLDLTKDKSNLYILDEAELLISENKIDILIEDIIKRFQELQAQYDFVLVQGLSRSEITSSIEYDINLLIAKNLSLPYISVLNGHNRSNDTIIESIKLETQSIKNEKCLHLATFVNKVNGKKLKSLEQKLGELNIEPLSYLLPYIKDVDTITVDDLYHGLECELLYGTKKFLNQKIYETKVASMTLDNYLRFIKDQDLIIVSGDRSDILTGTLLLQQSNNSPSVAGILLSGDLKPQVQIDNILNNLDELSIPILSTKYDTHTCAMKVSKIASKITAKSYTKISQILASFIKNIDFEKIADYLDRSTQDIMTPVMFEYELFKKASQDKKTIVLPEGEDDRILRASEILLVRDIVDIIIVGDSKTIVNRAKVLGVDISKAQIINPKDSHLTQKFAEQFYELRKDKGVLEDTALDIMKNSSNYFATMMVHLGFAHGMVSGASHTTADTVRPALQIIKTKKDVDIVSSSFFMCLDTKVLLYADCAINQSPNSDQLAQIAKSTAKTAKAFSMIPKVAMLSYSTGDSGSGDDVEIVKDAVEILNRANCDFDFEGPIQYDAAIDKEVASKKLPDSKVAGDANVLIFPDLNTGNNTYKAVQRSSGALAVGPVLQGLNKPVNDLSRGCTVKDIVNTVAITAIQAQEEKVGK
ncbi:MAG: phosphate acetyltransferase [Campylobacterota bacterium]|nr:phosphate acetyltransferase [Campylobacterota bacterium]